MKNIIQEMERLRSRCESFALATVITRNGSAPRSAGAKMLITQDGKTISTVGGGILEARVKQVAVEVLKNHQASVKLFQFSGNDAAAMDAICGGQVEVLIEWLNPDNPHTSRIIQALQTAIYNHHKIWLVTSLPCIETTTTHALINLDESVIGTLPNGLSTEAVVDIRQSGLVELDHRKVMIEPINIEGVVYIFGAGHVSARHLDYANTVSGQLRKRT